MDLEVTITLSAAAVSDVTGTYTLTSASAGRNDYTRPARNERLWTISAGETTTTITIETTDDTTPEGDETLVLRIRSDNPLAARVTEGTTTVTITDDDAVITVPETLDITEGTTGTVTVSRTGVLTNAVTGTYTLAPTTDNNARFNAIAGSDYTNPAEAERVFTIPAGAASTTISVATLDDEQLEPPQGLTLTIAGDAEIDNATTTIRIVDDDVQEVTVTADKTHAVPGETVTVTGVASKHIGANVFAYQGSVDGEVAGSLLIRFADADFVALIDTLSERTGTATWTVPDDAETGDYALTWAPLPNSLTATSLDESPELFAEVDTITVTVIPSVDLPEEAVEVGEGDGTVSLTVTMSEAAPTGGVSGTFTTTDGTATGAAGGTGADFANDGGTWSIAAGATTATISIGITDDSATEGSESFSVNIAVDSGDAEKAGAGIASATVTIIDDEQITIESIALQDSNDAALSSLSESAAAGAEVNAVITLSEALSSGSSDLTVTVSAAAADHAAISITDATATISAGESTATATFSALPASVNVAGGNANFDIVFTATGSTLTGFNHALTRTATLTIIDDEPPTATLAPGQSVTEGEATTTVTVTLSKPAPAGGTSVRWNAGTGSSVGGRGRATENVDFTVTPAGLSLIHI
ncbi:MAG: hypothetical protein MPK62_07665, partial [Alphaproteobacteria bacterium]|nr:hypothetical protein [Alphaproteobacteria bacterium]